MMLCGTYDTTMILNQIKFGGFLKSVVSLFALFNWTVTQSVNASRFLQESVKSGLQAKLFFAKDVKMVSKSIS